MDLEGPPLESLLHRISEIPEDLLAAPKIGNEGVVAVPAIVYDTAEKLGVTLSTADLKGFSGDEPRRDAARLPIVLLLCWVISEDWFRNVSFTEARLMELLRDISMQLAQCAPAVKYIRDPDRREELGRLVLAHFGYRPAGESKAQAQDRLTSLSVVERERVLRASKQAEERARTIRAALAKKAAEESADKWTRE